MNDLLFVKTRLIVRDEINHPLSYSGLTNTLVVSTVKVLSFLADRSLDG